MKKFNGTQEQYELFVKMTVDGLVSSSDFPVIANVLEEAEIADRATLRKLERKGILTCMRISVGRGHMNAYFTEDVLPKYERERRAQDAANNQPEQPDAGEELQGGLRQTEDQEEVHSRDREEDCTYEEARREAGTRQLTEESLEAFTKQVQNGGVWL